MLEDLEAHLIATIRKPPPPDEYIDFQLCLALGCTPNDLDDMEEHTLTLYREFMRLESESGRLSAFRREFYGK